ncbi:MAG: hypothetical protein WCT54_02945 [Patescibacteria group bacterium]|jgi:hypothetical protein
MNKRKIFLNTIFWGFVLWLFGYILGIVFFAFVPKEVIGWYIMPLAIIFTLWVLFKKIKRESFKCYVGLGVIWTIMAVILDYIFLVKLLQATDYYKPDIYLYYILTFSLPVAVGWYKKSFHR